jgi:hypothetical protein
VVDHLPSKLKALNSNYRTMVKKKETKKEVKTKKLAFLKYSSHMYILTFSSKKKKRGGRHHQFDIPIICF